MIGRRKHWIFITIGIVLGTLIVWLAIRRPHPRRLVVVTGAILRQDEDPHKQSPIADAAVTAMHGVTLAQSKSDAAGGFQLRMNPGVYPGEQLRLRFEHPDYQPLEMTEPAEERLYLVRMTPKSQPAELAADAKTATLTDIRIRYAVKARTTQNIGSYSRTFEVKNTANVRCEYQPCSPDGKWKATIVTSSHDAGEGNEFRNARVSCIAGPCSFHRIESDSSSRGGRTIEVSVRNWGDTTTFLIEAEVTHTMVSEMIRTSHPVIFGSAMSFTLPAGAQGPSIEAELDGEDIVFPLGPKLGLSWAACSLKVGSDQTKLYRCELKPGYRFKV